MIQGTVAIFVLIYKNKLLILDEFSNNMDLTTSIKIREALKNSDNTILMVSHNISEIISICNRFVIIDSGMIIDDKDSSHFDEEILKNYLLKL